MKRIKVRDQDKGGRAPQAVLPPGSKKTPKLGVRLLEKERKRPISRLTEGDVQRDRLTPWSSKGTFLPEGVRTKGDIDRRRGVSRKRNLREAATT